MVIFILPINSALNPILYTITTPPFQEQLKLCLQQKQSLQDPGAYRKSFTQVSIQTSST